MDIEELQSDVRRLMRGIEHPRVGAALALAEECGEVVRCVLERECYGGGEEGDLAAELGDLLVAAVELGDRYGVSLATCAQDALAKLEAKAPVWRAQLGDRLEVVRRRMDDA